jgi:DNA-binding NtrC family response regulator
MARILLADDDTGMLDTARRALELDGHAVTTAEDGAEARVKIGAGGGFDVLVADVQMPGLDGVTLAKQALATGGGLRVVLMSGHADALDKAKTIVGVRTLAKPFQIDQLRAAVRAALA